MTSLIEAENDQKIYFDVVFFQKRITDDDKEEGKEKVA
jgi:hypothetical protein